MFAAVQPVLPEQSVLPEPPGRRESLVQQGNCHCSVWLLRHPAPIAPLAARACWPGWTPMQTAYWMQQKSAPHSTFATDLPALPVQSARRGLRARRDLLGQRVLSGLLGLLGLALRVVVPGLPGLQVLLGPPALPARLDLPQLLPRAASWQLWAGWTLAAR